MLKTNQQKLKYLALFVGSLLTIIFSFYFRDELARLGSLGIIGIFIVNILGSATLFLPAPGIASVVAGGIVFNPILVAVIASIGSAIGDMVGFLLGHSGKEILFKKNSFWYKVFKEIFHRWGGVCIVLFSFIPNPVFDGVGILAGIFSYSPWRFFLYVLIGRFLRNILLAGFGSIF